MAQAARVAAQQMSGVEGAVRAGAGDGSGDGEGTGLGVGPGDSHGVLPPDAPGAKLYSPRTTPTSGEKTHVSSLMRKGSGPTVTTSERVAPERTSDSRVPYYEVVGDSARQAEDALAREEVPPAYRSTVRGYFNALQPGGTANGLSGGSDSAKSGH